MNASTFTVNGDWRRTPSAAAELEALTITGAHAPFVLPIVLPIAPEPARIATPPSRTLHDNTTDALGNLFGCTRPRTTRTGQRDSYRSRFLPPPYADPELPAYSAGSKTEPVTLARYLFKFGFLFPLLWVLGAIILVIPLTAPAGFEPSKSEVERRRLVRITRDAELKWAQRCACALFVLVVLASIAAAITFVAFHS